MKRLLPLIAVWLASAAILSIALPAAAADLPAPKPRQTLFIGVDTSGSFLRDSGDALAFLSRYISGHLNGLGGLQRPRELFVAAIGGRQASEAKAFHPIHDFVDKDVTQIEADLRRWFAAREPWSDFNVFFRQVARIAKERNLLLSPITVVVVSDGIHDVANVPTEGRYGESPARYQQIDLSPLEYLSKNVTLRLLYPSPKVAQSWRKYVSRQRVRFWAVDREVMQGWRQQIEPGAPLAKQDRFWKWVRDNVDFRVRSRGS